MSFLNIKNPKITHLGIDFHNYLNSKELSIFEIIITRDSPVFKFSKSLRNDELYFEGCLLKNPVCELPKSGLFNNFYSHKINQFRLTLTTSEKSDYQYEDHYGKISNINKKFNTNYKKREKDLFGYPNRNLDTNFGILFTDGKDYLSSPNGIEIYGSYSDYINFLYDNIINTDVEIYLTLAVQKIKEWDVYPIVDMAIRSWRGNLNDDDLYEITKGEIFRWSFGGEFPKHRNILIK